MDFALEKDQELIKKSAREFFDKECPKDKVRELREDPKGYDPNMWKKMISLGFLGLVLASMGVWFCMHQALLYQGEYLKGTLPSNIYVFLTFEIPPLLLHVVGNLFVIYGLILTASISAIKVVLGLLSQLGRLNI